MQDIRVLIFPDGPHSYEDEVMYVDRNRIRTVSNIIDALEELQPGPEEEMTRSLLDKIMEITEEEFRSQAERIKMF